MTRMDTRQAMISPRIEKWKVHPIVKIAHFTLRKSNLASQRIFCTIINYLFEELA